MDWLVFGLVVLAFAGGCTLVGVITRACTRSRTAGIVAGVLAAVVGVRHAFEAFAQAVGEYEGELTGYDALVHDHFAPLLIGSMAAAAVLVVVVHTVWRRVAHHGTSAR
jgi:hypothetical protein